MLLIEKFHRSLGRILTALILMAGALSCFWQNCHASERLQIGHEDIERLKSVGGDPHLAICADQLNIKPHGTSEDKAAIMLSWIKEGDIFYWSDQNLYRERPSGKGHNDRENQTITKLPQALGAEFDLWVLSEIRDRNWKRRSSITFMITAQDLSELEAQRPRGSRTKIPLEVGDYVTSDPSYKRYLTYTRLRSEGSTTQVLHEGNSGEWAGTLEKWLKQKQLQIDRGEDSNRVVVTASELNLLKTHSVRPLSSFWNLSPEEWAKSCRNAHYQSLFLTGSHLQIGEYRLTFFPDTAHSGEATYRLKVEGSSHTTSLDSFFRSLIAHFNSRWHNQAERLDVIDSAFGNGLQTGYIEAVIDSGSKRDESMTVYFHNGLGEADFAFKLLTVIKELATAYH